MATFVWAAAAADNWSVGANWQVGGVAQAAPPTATDDVLIGSGTGATQQNITVDATAVCQSIDCTGYTKTFTMGASISLSIGSATPGPGNVALKFVAGMTFASGNSSQIIFVSTSSTAQSVNFAGPTNIDTTLRNIQFTGTGGSWQLTSAMKNSSAGANLTHTRGTLDFNGQDVSTGIFTSTSGLTRTLTLGSSAITVTSATSAAWGVTSTGLTLTATTATVTLTGSSGGFFSSSFNWGGLSIVFSGAGTQTINGPTGAFTCANLTRTGTAVKTDAFTFSGTSLTVTGTLTLTGNSTTNRLLASTSVIGATATWSAGAVSLTNVDIMDVTAAGAVIPWTGTSLGNSLGNSNITFDTPVTRYAVVAGSASNTATWSASSGGGGGVSVPLPQDTVIFDAGSAAGTYTADMPRMGAGIDFTGFTATFTLGTTITTYGSLTMVAGMTFTPVGQTYFLAGRGTHTINSGGKTIVGLSIKGPNSTYSLLADLFLSSGLTFFQGSFTTNNFNITATQISSNTVNFAKTFSFGSSTMTITGTGAAWNWFTANNTILPNTATIRFTDTSATTKTLQGNDANYNGMNMIINGSATNAFALGNTSGLGTGFNNVTVSAPNHITFFSGKTLGFNKLIAIGSSGSVITLDTSTAASAATLLPPGPISGYYLSVKDITVSATKLYAYKSTDATGNTNVVFLDDDFAFNNYEFFTVGDGMSVGGDKIR